MGALLGLIPGLFSLIGSGVSGFFGYKGAQIDQINKVTDIIGASETSAATREQAVAQVIAAEAASGYWLSAVWRPLLMLCLTGLVGAYCFGWVTPNLMQDMPEHAMITQLFELLKIGVCGYMPLRSVEKIIDKLTLSGVLDKLIKK